MPVGLDKHGVFRVDDTGHRDDLPWSELTAVSACVVDLKTSRTVCVTFEHESGHILEAWQNDPGFERLAQGLCEALPGLLSDWLTRVRSMEPVVLWARPK